MVEQHRLIYLYYNVPAADLWTQYATEADSAGDSGALCTVNIVIIILQASANVDTP